jgi:hypothetical protein
MDCIERNPYRLVFRQDRGQPLDLVASRAGRRLRLRTATRALQGMQTEALVNYGPTGATWRVVCDEGPWRVGILREDGLKSIRVACFQPVGSVFGLLSDDSALVGGQERAPCGLSYLCAGISFGFMTQLGRYAEDEEATQTLLNMGEQTCYLHAACRSAIKTRIRVE